MFPAMMFAASVFAAGVLLSVVMVVVVTLGIGIIRKLTSQQSWHCRIHRYKA